jgi:hypothetical protein
MCLIDVAPSSLDFGAVAPANQATRNVGVTNNGGGDCHISGVAFATNSDPWFSLGYTPTSLVVPSGQFVSLTVTFSPASASPPLQRTGSLVFRTDDPTRSGVEVPLTARIQSNCTLAISPPAYNFGHVHLDDTATGSVAITNVGSGSCEVAGLALAPGGDSEFSIGAGQADHLTLAPLDVQSILIAFHAVDPAAPHHRTGQLAFQTTDAKQASVAIPLSADIDIGCDLSFSPDKVDFGHVRLNTTADSAITLSNDGSDACQVSGIGLDPAGAPGFTLGAGQALAFAIAPGAKQSISLQFGAFDRMPPHLKSGTLLFQTGNVRAPSASVPLSAYVDTVCVEASQWIYTVDFSGMFSRFDPATLTFTDIKQLSCSGDGATPFSMAVDQNAVAWVAYNDGSLFKVDTSTGACQATSFQPDQHGLNVFGMGFVFDPSTGLDTLYIAGGADTNSLPSELATVSFPSLVVTPIGPVMAGSPELSGTGDGSLWGFFPGAASASGLATLLRLDPKSGATLESHTYPTLTEGGDWAMKFWGGSFWIFVNQSLYQVSRDTPDVINTVITNTGHDIVGAGVSTCAPLQ